jgi:hypothetical protein
LGAFSRTRRHRPTVSLLSRPYKRAPKPPEEHPTLLVLLLLSAAVTPPPHRRPRCSERPLGTVALSSPFPPYHGNLPWPRAVARPSSDGPWLSANEESMMEPWTSRPCVVHHSMDRVHMISYLKIIPKSINQAISAKNPCTCYKSSRSPLILQTEPLEIENISRLALATL